MNTLNVNRKTLPCARVFRQGGFTFVELLVVIAIIAALMALCIGGLIHFRVSAQERATQMSMNAAVVVAETLAVKSPLVPDHRLANLYWVRPHTTNPPPPMVDTTGARRMSSTELLVFVAGGVPVTANALESQGALLSGSAVPAGWRTGSAPALVDVYQQNTSMKDVLYRAKCPNYDINNAPAAGVAVYALASPPDGYPLRTLFDAWGHEIAYRYYTNYQDLNGQDSTDVSTATLTSRHDAETMVQDEAAAAADGMGELQPAISAYGHPALLSAGPDGKWGAFIAPNRLAPTRDALADKTANRDADARDNLYSQEWSQ